MPGRWVVGEEVQFGQRPGLYSRFSAQATVAVTGGLTGVVGAVGKATQGPLDAVTTINSLQDYIDVYSDDQVDTYNGVRNILQGGAREVLFARVDRDFSAVIASGANDLIRLTTRNYQEGTLIAKVEITAQKVVLTLEDPAGTTVDTMAGGVSRPQTWTTDVDNATPASVGVVGTVQELINKINEDSYAIVVAQALPSDLTTVANNSFVAVASVAFVAGSYDYSSAIDMIGAEDFSVLWVDLSPVDSAWATVQSKVNSLRDDNGKYVQWVTGSESDSLLDNAISDAGVDDEAILFVHPGAKNTNETLQGYQLAARIAGMKASFGLGDSLTYKRIAGMTDVTIRYTSTDIERMINNGIMPIIYDGRGVKIERGINTLITTTTEKPASFKKVKVVRILDAISNALNISIADQVIGVIANNFEGRQLVLGAINDFLYGLSQDGVILPNYVVRSDPDNPPTLDRFFIVIGVQPVDSIEYVYNTIQVFE